MPIAFVQSNNVGFGTASSFAVAFLSNTVAGNLLLIGISHTGDHTSISDSQGNTISDAFMVGADPNCHLHYIENNIGGADTVTVNYGSTQFDLGCMFVAEYSGIATASALDKTATATGFGGTSNSGSTATTTQADELLIGVTSGTHTFGSYTPGSGWTERADITTGRPGHYQEKIVSSTGAYDSTATLSTNANWAAGIATFKAAIGSVGRGLLYSQKLSRLSLVG